MTDGWIEKVRSLLEAPAPAVLTTYREDGSALVSPVWFRWSDGAFEVVIAAGDVKLRHLAANRECILVVFESVPPFRGVEVRGTADLIEGDVAPARRARSPADTSAKTPVRASPPSARSPVSCSGSGQASRASGI